MKVFILANPASGSGRGRSTCDSVQEVLNRQHIPYDFFMTSGKNQEASLVSQIFPQLTADDRLLIIGGDGTLSLVLDSLPAEIPFGFIPAGSGNDFARGSRLSFNTADALDTALHGQPQDFYVIHYDDGAQDLHGLAVNNIGIGLDAAIVKATNESRLKPFLNKIKLGQLSYLLSALTVLFKKKPFAVNVNDDSFDNAFLFTLTKHPYFGGGIKIAPEADNTDNLIHLVEVDNLPKWHFPSLIKKILSGKHLTDKYVHTRVATDFQLSVSPTQPVQIDGEVTQLTEDTVLQLTVEKRTIFK